MKYTMGEKDYSKMAANIANFANEARVTQARGVKDMDVDAVEDVNANQWSDAEWLEYINSEEFN